MKIEFSIPAQRMRDILTTAYESGIAYWAGDQASFDDCTATREGGYVTAIHFKPAKGSKDDGGTLDWSLDHYADLYDVDRAELEHEYRLATS